MTLSPTSPSEGGLPELLAEYPASSSVGATIRRADAQLRIQQMAEAEATIRHQEMLNAEIEDRLQRMLAEHALNMEYLIRFGVAAEEREGFRQILQEVAEHGGMNLQQAADWSHARQGIASDATTA